MDHLEIWPLGDIEFGSATIDGARLVMFEMTDQVSGRKISVFWRDHSFVAFADHLRMAADAVLSGEFFDP